MIEFQHVYKSYGQGRHILADLTFKVSAGEFVYVAGPSGAGKSTLLKLIGGLEPPSRGSIQVHGHRLDQLSARARPYLRRAVGVILQDTHLLYDRSAIDNVLLPLAVTGLAPGLARARARAALEKVGLSSKENTRPIELSGGEQQRVNIARSMIKPRALLLLDEPTASLDAQNTQTVVTLIREAIAAGAAAVGIFHDHAVGNQLATRRIDMTNFRSITCAAQ